MSMYFFIQLSKFQKLSTMIDSYHELLPEDFWSDYLDVFLFVLSPCLQIDGSLLKEITPSEKIPSIFVTLPQERCTSRLDKMIIALRGKLLFIDDYEKIKINTNLLKNQFEEDVYLDFKQALPFFKNKNLQDFLKNFEEISFPVSSPFVLFCETKNGKTLGIKDTKTNYFYIKELETEEDKKNFIKIKTKEIKNEDKNFINFYELGKPTITLFFILKNNILNNENDFLDFPEEKIDIFSEKRIYSLSLDKQFELFFNSKDITNAQRELKEIYETLDMLFLSMSAIPSKEIEIKYERVKKYLLLAYFFAEIQKNTTEKGSSKNEFQINNLKDVEKARDFLSLLPEKEKRGLSEQVLTLFDCPFPSCKKKQISKIASEQQEEQLSEAFPQIGEGLQPYENSGFAGKSGEKVKKLLRG